MVTVYTEDHTHVSMCVSTCVWMADTLISSRQAKEWHLPASDSWLFTLGKVPLEDILAWPS